MINSIVLCLLVASSALAFPAADSPQSSSSGGCPGGYAEGAEIERGRLVFVCQGGQVVPKGCIAEDLTRLTVGGNYDTKNYRKKCQLGNDGQLTYELTGCVQNGQEHKSGETWDNGNNFYTCQTDGNSLKVVTQGCVEAGKHVNLKETVARADALYSCEEAPNGGSKLVPAGCVQDGKQFKVGDTFESGDAFYNCTRVGRERVVAKIAGCVTGGKRLNDGDRYNDNDVNLECNIEGGKATFRATGCVQKDGGNTVERRLGCTWVEGVAPLQYEWACQRDEAKNSAKKVQVRCNYNVGGGVYNIDPGCFRTVDKNAVFGCVQQGATLNLQSFQGEQAASGAGLHAC